MARNRKRRGERLPDGRVDAPAPEATIATAPRQQGAAAFPRAEPAGERDAGYGDGFEDEDEAPDADELDGGDAGRRGGSGGGRDWGSGGDSGEGSGGGERAPGQPALPALRSGSRLIAFLQGSWRELQRVQWPDRPQVMQATGVVIGFVIVAGVFLGVSDFVAQKIVTFILK